MSRIDEAVQLFEGSYLCSQAVFAVFSEDLGLSKENAFKIGACFGSGMRQAEVCGACSGALMALGLKYGDNKEKCDEYRPDKTGLSEHPGVVIKSNKSSDPDAVPVRE